MLKFLDGQAFSLLPSKSCFRIEGYGLLSPATGQQISDEFDVGFVHKWKIVHSWPLPLASCFILGCFWLVYSNGIPDPGKQTSQPLSRQHWSFCTLIVCSLILVSIISIFTLVFSLNAGSLWWRSSRSFLASWKLSSCLIVRRRIFLKMQDGVQKGMFVGHLSLACYWLVLQVERTCLLYNLILLSFQGRIGGFVLYI